VGTYDVQQVCLKGHQTTDSYNRHPQFRRKYCPTCGTETIYECPSCKHPIRGDYHVEGVFAVSTTPVPTHCENCGTAFPWTEAKLQAARVVGSSDLRDRLKLVEVICGRFHLVARQLNSRHDDRGTLEIKDEYDVQDLLHALLKIHFEDIRPEEWAPSYAGSSSRVDFLLKEERIVIEAKKTRKTLKAKEVGEQLILDIEKYKKHPDCKILVCFVYDPEGWIANPRGLEADLSSDSDEFTARVLVVPRGH